MKLLVAVDENAYSRYAVQQSARLAENTWSEVVMLGVEKNRSYFNEDELEQNQAHPKLTMLDRYRTDFLQAMKSDDGLYGTSSDKNFRAKGNKVLEKDASGRKHLFLHLRSGDPVKEVRNESREEESDLVIIGCGHHEGGWGRGSDVPGKIADSVDCSVFVIRENFVPAKIVCCLDHSNISQESLELINQWVSLYGAELEIVGVLKKGELREDLEAKMTEVLDYYLGHGIRALVRVVDEDSLESFIESGAKNELMALWLHQRSPLQKLLHSSKVASLVNHASSSIMIVR
ncbi:universal stress protein [Maridesulfovibrio bastinii]|uniref:universal stress protein n=1 Tax=Maridesulfovibrio bastinii TaxID=47157 RepID=UPI00041D942C|nr:universal stress protein [Maridesulfovibrio bastinii]